MENIIVNIAAGVISGLMILYVEYNYFQPKKNSTGNLSSNELKSKPDAIKPIPATPKNSSSGAFTSTTPNPSLSKNKNTVFAVLLSLFLGGAGQIYLGQISKGILLIFLAIVALISPVGLVFMIVCAIDAHKIAERINHGEKIGRWEFGLKPLTILLTFLASLIFFGIAIIINN